MTRRPLSARQGAYARRLSWECGFETLEAAILAIAEEGKDRDPRTHAARIWRAVAEGRVRPVELTLEEGVSLIGVLRNRERPPRADEELPPDDEGLFPG